MSKYDRLCEKLMGLQQGRWDATFHQIETILGAPLPKSAHRFAAWWANEGTHVQSKAWVKAGWKTEHVNLSAKRVSFMRIP